ncbi:hypothetical protein MKI84_15705 [Ancylobacter sp. A5.8]|uniref:hypothetical protein n=1 Tax=Ancylobacter gelatini TaxID=2919920 RepID=UPI001F4DCDD0|nr:hypothetical protein [Ancylobacter gelatini]MCJ8144368.1 hypothetical protein [Ancylobacter gelatini]
MDMLRNTTAPRLPILVDDDRLAGGPLGRDAGRDSDHNRAAVAIFGIAGLAMVGVLFCWLSARGSEPGWTDHPALMLPGGAPVPADAPMLRPGFDAGAGGDVTLLDPAESTRARLTAAPLPLLAGQPVTR